MLTGWKFRKKQICSIVLARMYEYFSSLGSISHTFPIIWINSGGHPISQIRGSLQADKATISGLPVAYDFATSVDITSDIFWQTLFNINRTCWSGMRKRLFTLLTYDMINKDSYNHTDCFDPVQLQGNKFRIHTIVTQWTLKFFICTIVLILWNTLVRTIVTLFKL